MREQHGNGDRSSLNQNWSLAGSALFFQSTICDRQAILLEQVHRAVTVILENTSANLSDSLHDQVEESIVKAINQHTGLLREHARLEGPREYIQFRIYLARGEKTTNIGSETPTQWGFFLVQKQNTQAVLPNLILDLFLYRE
jgi:hypothetical protein